MPALFSINSKLKKGSLSVIIFGFEVANLEASQQIFSTQLKILRFLGKTPAKFVLKNHDLTQQNFGLTYPKSLSNAGIRGVTHCRKKH